MRFRFTEEQELIRDTARGAAARWADRTPPLSLIESGQGVDRAAWTEFAADLGFAGLIAPPACGGAGLGMVELVCVAEALGAQLAPIPFLSTCGLATAALTHCASSEARAAFLPRIAEGRLIATWAHRARGEETNRLQINPHGVLSGAASHVLHGAVADVIVASALTARGDEVVIALERGAPGLTITPRTCLDLTQPVADLVCEGVRCAPEALAQPSPEAVARALDQARLALAGEQLGAAQSAFDRTLAYVGERVQFGRKIGSFQAIKHRLADRACELESARSAVYYGACAFDEGHADSADAAAIAAWFAATTFKTCVRDMIQFHGGIGFTWEHVAHLYFKRAWASEKMLGGERRHLEHLADQLAASSPEPAL